MPVAFASGEVVRRGACNAHAVHGQRSGGSTGVCCIDVMRLRPDQGLLELLARPMAQARCFAEAS